MGKSLAVFEDAFGIIEFEGKLQGLSDSIPGQWVEVIGSSDLATMIYTSSS